MNDPSHAEKAVLGEVLLNGEKIYELMSLVRMEDFSLSSHREIYSVMSSMAAGSVPIDIQTLSERLRQDKKLEALGGVVYLADLGNWMNRGLLRQYAKDVTEHARRRRLLKLCELGMSIVEDGESLENCLARIETGLLTIRSDERKPEATALKGFTIDALNRLVAMHDSPQELIGCSTGIPELNISTTGIREGELWVIGALPGRGKTAIGIQIAAEAAKVGKPTAVFSLEMSREQLLYRILCGESGVPAGKVRNPRWLNDTQLQYLSDSASDVMEWPLYVDDASSLTTHELMARAKLYIRRYGVRLLVVDYLRLIESPGKELRERVANAANCLRQVAKDENVAIVALSQLRRPQNINDRPTMIDLKESGDVEAHAHTVLLLYQPIKDGDFTHEDEIIIGKQRNGPLGTIKVVFDTKSLRFLPREGTSE